MTPSFGRSFGFQFGFWKNRASAIPYSKSVLAFRQTCVVSALIALASCVENASDRSRRILGRWGRVGKGAQGDYSHDLHWEFTSLAHPCAAVPKLQANLPTGSKDSVRRKEIILAQLGDPDALLPERFVPSGWQLGIGYLAHTSFASFTFLIFKYSMDCVPALRPLDSG